MLYGSGDAEVDGWANGGASWPCEAEASLTGVFGFSSMAGGKLACSPGDVKERSEGGKHAASPSFGDGEEKAEVIGLETVDAVRLSNMLGAVLSVGDADDTSDGGSTSIARGIASGSAFLVSNPNGS